MQTIKKVLNIFFVTLGVIFFIILSLLSYIYFTTDLFSFFSNNDLPVENSVTVDVSGDNASTTESVTPNTLKVSPTQEKALETIGVKVESLPSNFTPEQIACFETVLGTARVKEIKAGDTPTMTELIKAKGCI